MVRHSSGSPSGGSSGGLTGAMLANVKRSGELSVARHTSPIFRRAGNAPFVHDRPIDSVSVASASPGG